MRLWNRTIEQMGGEAREVLSRQPERDEAMVIVLDAWADLSTCRQMGMGEGRIPWDKAKEWAEDRGLSVEARRVLWAVIQRIDIEELERRAFARNRPAGQPTGR